MKRRLLSILLCAVLLLSFAVTASADIGPKPSTHITTHGDGRTVYITLLSDEEHYGPNRAVTPEEAAEDWFSPETSQEYREAWYAFLNHGVEGWYWWGTVDQNDLSWGYYPPERFKLALYFPDTDALLISSETYERYAFESDYVLYLNDLDSTVSATVSMNLRKTVDWTEEIAGLLFRAAATILIELLLALLWGYRDKRQILIVILVNLITQLALNGLLWFWYTFGGFLTAMLRLIQAEVLVVIVESVLYGILLSNGKGRWKAVLYAVAANLLSVTLGWWLIT